jgi:endonuclease/exonuclease/phosphatase family metal-dependent hydrolase
MLKVSVEAVRGTLALANQEIFVNSAFLIRMLWKNIKNLKEEKMIAHEQPNFTFNFNVNTELQNLEEHKILRQIPDKRNDRLLIASWNLTNFGLQNRRPDHLKIMSKIISYFDLIAIQEIADNLDHFNEMLSLLGSEWDSVYTDIAGNQERLGYIFDKNKVQPVGLVSELALRGYEKKKITIQLGDIEESMTFEGFNRNPYMINFKSGNFNFTVVNVHLYWSNYNMRILEAKALSAWAKNRVKKEFPPNNDIILIGDFNMEYVEPGDKIYDALKSYGLTLPKHQTQILGTNLAGEYHYDEVAFFPSKTNEDFTDRMGVFDFDNAIFPALWSQVDSEKKSKFMKYIRYFIADHRPIWIEFRI